MANTELRLADCEVSYWETDGGNIVASVKSPVASGLLILRSGFKPGDDWELLPRNSPTWNWFHQSIFRNFRADEATAETVRQLPALPAVVVLGELLPPEHFLQPSKPLLTINYPAIKNCLDTLSQTSVGIYVLLLEDVYETRFGDGKFHDLKAVFLNAAEAQACAKEIESAGWNQAHERRMTVTVSGETIGILDFKLQLFDTESFEAVLAMLEKNLSRMPRPPCVAG